MNILLLHESAVPGGLETRLLTHASLLRARGHRVVAVRKPGMMSEAFAEIGVEEVGLDFFSRSGFEDTVARLRQLIRSSRIDLCDVHPFWSLLPGALAALAEGVPYGLNFHGHHDWDNELLLFRRSLSLLWPHAAFATANSPGTRDFFERSYGLGGARFQCVPNVVDAERLRAAPRAALPPRRLLVLSRLDGDKLLSFRAALRAIEAYAQVSPGPIEVRVSGGGGAEQSAREEARALEQRGVRIEWRGATAHPNEEIGWADAVFGIGRVALEGLAARRPVVICGVLGNLAGVCSCQTIEPWFESNLNGRNGPDQPAAEVARALASIGADEVERLSDWVLERAGAKRLSDWVETVERSAELRPSEEAVALGQALIGLFSDYFRLSETTKKAAEDRQRAELACSAAQAHDAAVTSAALQLERSLDCFLSGARNGLKVWPPQPLVQARSLWDARYKLLPQVREAITLLHAAIR